MTVERILKEKGTHASTISLDAISGGDVKMRNFKSGVEVFPLNISGGVR